MGKNEERKRNRRGTSRIKRGEEGGKKINPKDRTSQRGGVKAAGVA